MCLYIHILAAFLLGGLGINTPRRENIVTVIIILAIGAVGRLRGLDMLMVLERWALRFTGLLVLLLIVGFALFDWRAFQAGTRMQGEELVASGGRVLNVTASGKTVREAQAAAYQAVDAIDFPSGFVRRDIGWREILREGL